MIDVTEIPITKTGGIFHCPGCRDARPYKRRVVYRFLTIYFVPIVPIERVSEHVRCGTCREAFATRVLQSPLNKPLDSRNVNRAVIFAALRIVMLDDRETRDELAELQRLIFDRTGIEATLDHILAMKPRVVGDDRPTTAYWLSRAKGMEQKQRERAIRDLFVVASADRHLRPRQLAEFAELPRAMEIPTNKLKRLVLQACEDYSDVPYF